MGAPLPLAEHAVLGLLVEAPSHGFALSRHLAPTGGVGRAYSVARPAVYRALDRLVAAGLATAVGEEAGTRAPARTVMAATAVGVARDAEWIAAPAPHVRDLRTTLLVKLALLDRRGVDPAPLIEAQRSVLVPIVGALEAQVEAVEGFDRTLALWRATSGRAAVAFLDALRRPSPTPAPTARQERRD